jgi:hypothetical protein
MYSLPSGASLDVDQQLTSENGRFVLVLQQDGNLVLYRLDAGTSWPIWASGTTEMRHLWMQGDGNLVGVRADGTSVFATGTSHPGGWLTLQDDGNLIVMATSDDRLIPQWSTGPAPAARLRDELAPGEGLDAGGEQLVSSICDRLSVQYDGNVVFADSTGKPIWATGTSGSGGIRLQYQYDGNLVLVDGFGKAHWASNTAGEVATVVSVNPDATLRLASKVLAHRTWWSPGCGPTEPPDVVPPDPAGPDDPVDQPVVTRRLTILARVGDLGVDPNLTVPQQQGLSIESFDVKTNYSTIANLTYQRPQGVAPARTLRQTFSYQVAPTTNITIRLAVNVGVPGAYPQIPVTVVRPDRHHSGDEPDEFRYGLGAADDTLTLDVDYGPGPDGTIGWLVVPKLNP